jgi:hypothetical protein
MQAQGGAMNHRIVPASNVPLFLVAGEPGQTPDAACIANFQELYSLGMDRALGMEKASLDAVVRLHSCLIDLYQNAFCFAPELGNLIETAVQSVAFCMEVQLSWLALLAPHASSHGSTTASNSGNRTTPTAEELAHSMDIAIGEWYTAPGGTVASISDRQARPAADVRENNMDILEIHMDIAIGAHAA